MTRSFIMIVRIIILRLNRRMAVKSMGKAKNTDQILSINFPGASTQTPQWRLPPAPQERGISPNLATLGASLYAPMLMYGKEASNRKQEIDRQHYTITTNIKLLAV